MAFAVPSRAVVETDSSLYVLVLEKEENGIYHFTQKEVVVNDTIQRIFSPKKRSRL
jgi:hypothetical protein